MNLLEKLFFVAGTHIMLRIWRRSFYTVTGNDRAMCDWSFFDEFVKWQRVKRFTLFLFLKEKALSPFRTAPAVSKNRSIRRKEYNNPTLPKGPAGQIRTGWFQNKPGR